jgi:N-acetylglutamate synthase-like GNAT family acetyltransferase
MTTTVRRLRLPDVPACHAIIHALPNFFADPKGIQHAAAALRDHEGWVTEDDGTLTGFLTLIWPFPEAAEISWLAVHPDFRRRGRGRMLVEQAATRAKRNGAQMLYLFTSTSRDSPGVDGYEGTRQFYAAVGFLRLWTGRQVGWNEDSLLMVRPLG